MTLTAQLDEIERFARSEQKSGWPKCAVDFDVTLQLIAIARAALAWQQERKSSRSVADMALIVALTERP